VKAHPNDAAARVVLARVYAEQGKDRKALEELQAALISHPQDGVVNRMAGLLHMKLGEREPGRIRNRLSVQDALVRDRSRIKPGFS
jgi:Tfp pilus assembly protein PilF